MHCCRRHEEHLNHIRIGLGRSKEVVQWDKENDLWRSIELRKKLPRSRR